MAKAKKVEKEISTEEKIKEAARIVFTRKGYAATRTRDIAEEAGINLALLNYYFRSKEKLFDLIMLEKLGKFFGAVQPVLNDATTSLEDKVNMIASTYIDLLGENPDLPLFVMSEIRSNPDQFVHKLPVGKVLESHFIKQLQERRPDVHPLHYLMSILGLTIFPYIMKPIFQLSGIMNERAFNAKMDERRTLIPKWLAAMLKAK